MNVCAVRTIAAGIGSARSGQGVSGIWWTHFKPHEPKSEHRFVLKPVSENRIDSLQWLGDYAECKHCNSIFAVEEAER